METAFGALARTPYLSLTTFRRDGRAVATPVWVAGCGDRLVVFSEGDAGKVKRLRRDPRVRLQPCDVRGRTRGRACAGLGRILTDAAEIERAHAALRAKYGWQMWLVDLGSRLAGRIQRRAWLSLEVGDDA